MNKNVKLAMAGAALIFGACADYSVDSEDVMIKTSNPGNGTHDIAYYVAPEDYDLEIYLSINPDVKYFQIVEQLRTVDNLPRLEAMKSDDPEVKAAAKAAYDADNAKFLGDETLAKKAFLMAGFPETMWPGIDSLTSTDAATVKLMKNIKSMMLRFNKQQLAGEPSVAEDIAYIDNFQYDYTLLDKHYVVFGVLDGRAYRNCTETDITIPSGENAGKHVVAREVSADPSIAKIVNLADTLGAQPRKMDYSANYFCRYVDGLSYPIWNAADAERLNRIVTVKDSLDAVAPAPVPESSSAAVPESSSDAVPEDPASSSDVAEPESSSEAVPEDPASSSDVAVPESSSEAAPEDPTSSSDAVLDPESSSSTTI